MYSEISLVNSKLPVNIAIFMVNMFHITRVCLKIAYVPQRFDGQWPSNEAAPTLDKPTLFIESLVGGIPTPLKNISQLGLLFPFIPNICKNKKGSKPPTR